MNIIYILAGVVAFCLFLVYDIKLIKGNSKVIKSLFFVGILILVISTGLLLASGWSSCNISLLRAIPFLIAAAVFLLLLIYTLFFALPFTETYITSSGKPKVCMTGVYGICRHPGFLWFFGLYGCLALAIPSPGLIAAWIIFSLCNLGYIIMQDVWTFPNQFDDYDTYKKKVPFLIPTIDSIRTGMKSL